MQPATVLKAGPCVVVQAKTAQTDGYEAVQLGLVEEKAPKVNKAIAGHYKKADVPPTRVRREVKVAKGAEAPKAGEQVLVGGLFAAGERWTSSRTSRGLGFQGVVKRHHFAGGAATHGSMFHRAPGSIGASVVSVARRQGHAGGRAHGQPARDDAEPARGAAWMPRTTCCIVARRGAGRGQRLRADPQGDCGQARAQAAGRGADQGQGEAEEVGLWLRLGLQPRDAA